MSRFEELAASGVKIFAPPMYMLVKVEGEGYRAVELCHAGQGARFRAYLTWTLERSGPLASGGGWYYAFVT